MKATVPTALHLDDNKEYTTLVPYSEGKLHPTYVPGEFGYKSLEPTFRFPDVAVGVPGSPGTSSPLVIVRQTGDFFKRSLLTGHESYTVNFDPTTKTATITGEIPYYTTGTYAFLPADGNYMSLGFKFPTILSSDSGYDLVSLEVGGQTLTPPILTSDENNSREVYVLLPVDIGKAGNTEDIIVTWKSGIEVETSTISYDGGLTVESA